MKRILFILAVYVVASFGVQAQVVSGDEPYEILWEMEFDSTNYFGTSCISPDSNSYYYLGGETKRNEAIYKRSIETNEIEEKFPISFSDDSEYIWQMQASDKYLAYIISYNDTLYLRDINTFELKKKIRPDMNELINNFDNICNFIRLRDVAIQISSKYVILMYFFTNSDNDVFHFLVSYDLNNDTYNMFYDNLSENHIDSKIEKLQLSNDGNKLYAVRYYSINPGETLVNFYEWDLSNDFERKELKTNISNDDFSFINHNYKVSPNNSNLFMYDYGIASMFIYYDLLNKNYVKTDGPQLYYNFCFTEFNDFILYTEIKQGDLLQSILYNIKTGEKYYLTKSLEYANSLFTKPIGYITSKSIMLSYNTNQKLKAIKFNFDVIMSAKEDESIVELLYPNPASETINIPINEFNERIEVYDMRGNVVYSTPSLLRNATPQEGNLKIDVSQLPKGVYFVKIGNNIEKFVKM